MVQKVKQDDHEQFTRNVKQKIGEFMNSIQTIYTELVIEHTQHSERVSNFFKELAEQKDANQIVRQAFQYSQEAKKHFTESDGFYKQKN